MRIDQELRINLEQAESEAYIDELAFSNKTNRIGTSDASPRQLLGLVAPREDDRNLRRYRIALYPNMEMKSKICPNKRKTQASSCHVNV